MSDCPIGLSLQDPCPEQSAPHRVPNSDDEETLRLRCGFEVPRVCDHHWTKYFKLYSYDQTRCCDPRQSHRDEVVRKGLRIISLDTARLHSELKLIPGTKICRSCRNALSQQNKPEHQKQVPMDTESGADTCQGESSSCDSDLGDVASASVLASTSMVEHVTIPTINQALDVIGESPLNPKRMELQRYGTEKLLRVNTGIRDTLGMQERTSKDDEEIIDQLKEPFANATRSEQIQILTLVPRSWSVRRIQEEFKVTSWMARTAKNLQTKEGIMVSPNPNPGKRLPDDTIETVRDFFLSDDVSRLMPGKKDTVSVFSAEKGKRIHIQKRLILGNLKENYRDFQSKFPGLKIGFSKFAELRPKECVLAGASGTHSVCVCAIHQNVKLMMNAVHTEETYHNYLAQMCCNPARPQCFLGECEYCPGTKDIKERMLTSFDGRGTEKVAYKQWMSTDRCDLKTIETDVESFCENICEKLGKLCPHDFIAKQQAAFLVDLKSNIGDHEVIVCGDFSENYGFVIQDAVQGYHWTNRQATVHPFVLYIKSEGVIKPISCVVISDYLTHDTVAVSYFLKAVMPVIKSKITPTRVYYFSDGAAAQYKNRKNFANLERHEKDHGMPAEWHFFATSHGKGPCDGIGGTVKRMAARASLQRPLENQIQTPEQLYEWATQNLPGIISMFCSAEDIGKHEEKLKERLQCALTVQGTQKLHAFYPADERNHLKVKRFSYSDDSRKVRVLKN